MFGRLERNPIPFLMSSHEPWVKYNTLLHLQNRKFDDPEVIKAKKELLSHPLISTLIEDSQKWPSYPLTHHNDAKHPIHKIALLADLGFKSGDPHIDGIIKAILSHQSAEGALLTELLIPKVFGGSDKPEFSWMLCDSPTLLYALLSFGLTENRQVKTAIEHLKSLVRENGWPCVSSLPKFRGPGRKEDFCPYANLISLKALSKVPQLGNSEVCKRGIEAQLNHWKNRKGRKIYMFGIGTNFQKLKYPNVWYDILHVVDVLSCFEYARKDERFNEMLAVINSKQQENSGFIPESIWRAYKDWDFGQKKNSSPWMTYKIALINKRCNS